MPNKKNNKVELEPIQEKVASDLRGSYSVKVAPRNFRFIILGSGNRRVVVLMSPPGGIMEAAVREKGQTDLF